MDIVELILKIGSLAGLIGITYQIHNNRKNRPSFVFTFEASEAKFYKENQHPHCDYYFSGIIRNTSIQPNTLVRLYLTVWENKRKSMVLRFGHAVKQIKECNTNGQLHLPLRFRSKEAIRLHIIFKFPMSGTQDRKLMLSLKEVKLGDKVFKLPKYKYEFLMEDVNGNFFDYGSSVYSKELIDSWWVLPNFSRHPVDYICHLLSVTYKYIVWKVSKFLSLLGFYK